MTSDKLQLKATIAAKSKSIPAVTISQSTETHRAPAFSTREADYELPASRTTSQYRTRRLPSMIGTRSRPNTRGKYNMVIYSRVLPSIVRLRGTPNKIYAEPGTNKSLVSKHQVTTIFGQKDVSQSKARLLQNTRTTNQNAMQYFYKLLQCLKRSFITH
jgi:hypothetical protein